MTSLCEHQIFLEMLYNVNTSSIVASTTSLSFLRTLVIDSLTKPDPCNERRLIARLYHPRVGGIVVCGAFEKDINHICKPIMPTQHKYVCICRSITTALPPNTMLVLTLRMLMLLTVQHNTRIESSYLRVLLRIINAFGGKSFAWHAQSQTQSDTLRQYCEPAFTWLSQPDSGCPARAWYRHVTRSSLFARVRLDHW